MKEVGDKITLLITGGAGYVASIFLSKYFGKAPPFSRLDDSDKSPGEQRGIGCILPEDEADRNKLKNNYSNFQLQRISKIILIDRLMPAVDLDSLTVPIHFHQADMSDKSRLNEALKGVDIVYHLASYGMSGREQLHHDLIWRVNVTGTLNVIEACQLNNVKALVFISTVNVVYGGQKIENGDESLPYFNAEQRPWDNYGNSKMQAEKAVLQANGSITADGKSTLRTCSLRLSGIYGPNERRHFPRIVKLMKQGLFKVTYGDNPIVEYVHSENVAKALLLATDALLQQQSKAAGEAYFISDGAPINNFDFFKPLTEALNISHPKISVPMWLVFFLAHMVELIYKLVHPLYDFQPLLCRAEVYKTGKTHYFSIEKASRDLKYQPDYQNDLSEIVNFYKKSEDRQKVPDYRSSFVNLLVNICLVVFAVCLFMSYLPTVS